MQFTVFGQNTVYKSQVNNESPLKPLQQSHAIFSFFGTFPVYSPFQLNDFCSSGRPPLEEVLEARKRSKVRHPFESLKFNVLLQGPSWILMGVDETLLNVLDADDMKSSVISCVRFAGSTLR